MNTPKILVSGLLLLLIATSSCKSTHPKANSKVMLEGSWVPDDSQKIDFEQLPKIKNQHTIVNDARSKNGVNQHNYLIHHAGKFWVMWSDGPGVEDKVGQRVAFATSIDGLTWSDPEYITPYPPNSKPNSAHYNTRSTKGFRYISRGFWKRDNELLALVSLDEADSFFGPSLELRVFQFNPQKNSWEDIGLVYDNTINNFPPKLLPNGEWMMSRRTFDRNVYMLTGGIKGIDQWKAHPVVEYGESELVAEEPYWWVLPDKNLLALFRDNAGSGYLFRAFSTNNGRTWSRPIRTDFPDARSKFNGLQLSDGRFVLVSNPNPKQRDPLALSISDDGIIFNKMGYLFGGRRIDYPHIIEHEGYLLVAFSGGKQSVEVLKIKISELDKLQMPKTPLVKKNNIQKPKNGSAYVVAHRGAHNGIPENSLAAYQKAIDLGCDFVEIDVRSTKDGHLVSVHNSTIDAYVKNVSGKVNDFTLAELKALDIGEHLGSEWKNTRIPTVEEILQLCQGRIGIYLDLKEPLVEELVELIKKYKMERNVLWCIPTSHMEAILEVKELCPTCIPMPDPGEEINLKPALEKLHPQIVAPVMRDFSETYTKTAHSYGSKVIVDEGKGDEKEWEWILSLGTDGIQTDHPEKLINFLKTKSKESN